MSNDPVLRDRTKTYSDQNYLYTSMVRHKGALIAFAMDARRRIHYAILDMNPAPADAEAARSPLDVNNWPAGPSELIFPNEIAETGFGIADQTQLPAYPTGSRVPVEPGTRLGEKDKDFFLSTTARLSAAVPFQVLSDGRFIYLFRQAIDAAHEDMVFKRDAKGAPVNDVNGRPVPLVDSTLLVDRFVQTGNRLSAKMEVRFQRSRSKTRPQSRKDGLGAKDLDGNTFFEPTQELKFAGRLTGGRFAVVLLPTQVAEIQRWQIFTENSHTGRIDALNVERSAEGLFNTRGSQVYTCPDHPGVFAKQAGACVEPGLYDPSQPCGKKLVPRIPTEGYAASALKLEKPADHVELPSGPVPGETFTLEAWLYPARTNSTVPQALITDGSSGKNSPPSVWIEAQTRVRTGFGDGQQWNVCTSKSILTPDTWNHLAVSYDGAAYRFYVGGILRDKIELTGAGKPVAQPVRFFGAPKDSFRGVIDEIRLWNRSRSAPEFQADLHQRLTGMEPGLAGYWQFDEAEGDTVYDQTGRGSDGVLHGGLWVGSDAPVGENPGINRNSFQIAGRGTGGQLENRPLQSGMSAMLYYQQANVPSGYDGKQKPLKQNARVMLAVATRGPSDANNPIAVLDFGVSNSGRIAQAPGRLALETVPQNQPSPKTVNEQLDEHRTLQEQLRALHGDVTLAASKHEQRRQEYQKLLDDLQSARVTIRGITGSGELIVLLNGAGDLSYERLIELGMNDRIQALSIPGPLQATVYEHSGWTGQSAVFTEDVTWADGDFWRSNVSGIRIATNPAYETKIAKARQRRDQARQDLSAKEILLSNAQKALNDHQLELQTGARVVIPLVYIDRFGLSVSGGLLGFAWTNDTPLLFDSATGTLALYFRGADDQFFAAYYNTFTERAMYPLFDDKHEQSVVAVARSTDLDMDKIVVEVSGPEDGGACTVTITGAGMEETWLKVPRSPEKFARVLNGEAGHRVQNKRVGYREYIGSGAIVQEGGQNKIILGNGGIRHALEAGATLMLGSIRVSVPGGAASGATELAIESDAILLPTEALPLYYLEYDYAANARTTKVPGDLFGGSLLLRAVQKSAVPLANQRISSGATVTSTWTAAAPGTALVFDGSGTCAYLEDKSRLGQFDIADDLTFETWVRPVAVQGQVRLLQHQSDASAYLFGLEQQDLFSALLFDGTSDYITIPDHPSIRLAGAITVEAWILPAATDGTRNIVAHGYPHTGIPELFLRMEAGQYQFGIWSGGNSLAALNIPEADQQGKDWVHLAGVYDPGAKTWTLYRNGIPGASFPSPTGPLAVEADWGIGANPNPDPGTGDRRLFKGAIDDVRIWKRARSQAEILMDMNRQLSGNETDLVGYWHFENKTAGDISRNNNDGILHGAPAQAVSPLPAYAVFAGVNGKYIQTKSAIPAGNWTHLTAVFEQPFGLKFDGKSAYLDCGKDDSLNINTDLTIELFLQAGDLNRSRDLLSRGAPGSGSARPVPYALAIDRQGHIVFSFEDQNGENHAFISTTAIDAGKPHRIAVSRRQQTLIYRTEKLGKSNRIYAFAWHDIVFYIDDHAPDFQQYVLSDKAKTAIALAQKPEADAPDNRDTELSNLLGAKTDQKVSDIGRNDQALEVGLGHNNASFDGIISELRIWNTAREAIDIGKGISSKEKGLVSWWRFRERSGNQAADSNSQNHATINGNAKWVKDPDPQRAMLTLYGNEHSPWPTAARAASDFQAAEPQFTLGALGNGAAGGFFQGALEDLRIWKTLRTQEQIEDNLFRRLDGELDALIAYYTFDAETTQNKLSDQALRGNHLRLKGAAAYELSTAPIGPDAPMVRSALAGVRTPFSGNIQSTPAVQEYGDLQYDPYGNLIGVFKRCYGYVQNGQWRLITGFKVGDLVTEWIGQVQFAPQLIGFIEGAPPVPSENLTQPSVEMIGDLDDYNEASVVEWTQAEETTYSYSASKEQGFGLELEAALKFGFKSQSEAGIGFISSVEESRVLFGLRAQFEAMWSWMEESAIGVGRETGKSTYLELRGRYTSPEESANEPFGRRFVPDNTGLALVQSETADVFALRLRHNNALISFQLRPNPDIPKDWNILSFPINPRYVKQGTLDGKIGPVPDVDYPNALTYSPDTSYFKPAEAYALKNRINRETTELETYYSQFAAADKGRLAYFPSDSALELAEASELRKKLRRNLVNTYVWTVDGGLFAETEQTMDVQTETNGGSYTFTGKGGFDLAIGFAIAKVASVFELSAMFVGHHQLSVSKTKESKSSFRININLDKVERDIYQRDPDDRKIVLLDQTDPKRPRPIKHPYKVDAYRFMTFYLEPASDNFETFFNRVVDPIWLEQSDEPAAAALREARDEGKKPPCWRILHRVTFVSRVLPRFDASAPPSLEKTLQTLDIDSNYELIKQLEPYVGNKLSSIPEFAEAVRTAIQQHLPELQPHTDEIIQYLRLYFGIGDGPAPDAGAFGENTLFELAPNQPPIVNAGPDQTIGLDGASTTADLDATVIDDRLERAEAIFVRWEKISGNGNIHFDDPHALKTGATFTKRGRYVLRLTADDGLLQSSDDLTVVVNERPVISAGADQQIDALQTTLSGLIVDSGFGDPQTGVLTAVWAEQGLIRNAVFDNKNALATGVTFAARGQYLLQLSVSNGTFDTDDEVRIAVASRSTEQLQALYTFEGKNGAIVRDVSGTNAPLDLSIRDKSAVQWIDGGLTLLAPTLLSAAAPASRLTNAIRASGAFSIEAWIKPAETNKTGLARIATLSDGPSARNFLLGQNGNMFHFGLRSTTTSDNAGNKAFAGGNVAQGALIHLVGLRDAGGMARLYLNGTEVASRLVNGDFSTWGEAFQLALGNETGATDGHDHAWLGTYHLLAVYSRALSLKEIRQHFDFGPDANLPPIVTAGADQVINWPDAQPSVTVTLDGRVAHDRLSTGSVKWTQVAGPGSPSGILFANDQLPATTAAFRQKGRYVLRLTADDSAMMMSDETVITVNRPPQIALRTVPQHLALTAASVEANLIAEITDTGLGDEAAGALAVRWSRISGPAALRFEDAGSLQTQASFAQRGLYQLKLEVSNGFLNASIPFSVTVDQQPAVHAGAAIVRTLPLQQHPRVELEMEGALTDSGLGNPQEALNILWEKISGPADGLVEFADASQIQTKTAFTIGGVYLLRLNASNAHNPALHASADVQVTVNRAPVVDAGPDPVPLLLQVKPGGPSFVAALLDGTVSDDGLPDPPGVLALKWSKVSGPGNVSILRDDSDYAEARFTQKGKYVFQLSASDGDATASDQVTVLVHTPPSVNAGPQQKVTATQATVTLELQGRVLDEGFGDKKPQDVIVAGWTFISGPAPAVFTDAGKLKTGVTVPNKKGVYQLRLSCDNGFGTHSDATAIIVNLPPVFDVLVLDAGARKRRLECQVADSGLGNPQLDVLSVNWRKVTGQEPLSFTPDPANPLHTEATFAKAGSYELEITVENGTGYKATKRIQVVIP